jgi:hypothetical protein
MQTAPEADGPYFVSRTGRAHADGPCLGDRRLLSGKDSA